MHVHLLQIPEGYTLHLAGQEDASYLGLEEAGGTAVGPLIYDLEAGLSGDGLFVTGSLRVRVRFTCVITLEPFETEIVIPDFAMQKELDGREQVDLTPDVREDIHLALPAHPRSEAAGDGSQSAGGSQASAEPQQAEDRSPWQALDQLKPKP